MDTLRLAEFCAGTGAFSLAGGDVCKTVYANDYDKNSKKVFDNNFSVKLDCRDIHSIPAEEVPQMDILTAGFPCQPYSLAGKKLGFADDRSNVFWKLLEILECHKPAYAVLENVKNLLTHDSGNTFKVILKNLQDIGYNVKYAVLNTSKICDIPHNRERLYFVCFRDNAKCDNFKFPEHCEPTKTVKDFLEPEPAEKYYYSDKYVVYDKLRESVVDENVVYQYRRTSVRANMSGVCPCLTANMGGGGHNVPIIKDTKGIRKLTPREVFNLQGFPQRYDLRGLSDTALYKLAGNAVTVGVVQKIFLSMLDLA